MLWERREKREERKEKREERRERGKRRERREREKREKGDERGMTEGRGWGERQNLLNPKYGLASPREGLYAHPWAKLLFKQHYGILERGGWPSGARPRLWQMFVMALCVWWCCWWLLW